MSCTSTSLAFPSAAVNRSMKKYHTGVIAIANSASCLSVVGGGSINNSTVTTSGAIVTEGRRKGLISCEVVASSSSSSTTTTTVGRGEGGDESNSKIGARVRVKVPLKVYHVPRVPEVDLTGKEGHIKQYVALWKGKRISANLPYKVEFLLDIEGRGPVKFFSHLKEDEFDFLD